MWKNNRWWLEIAALIAVIYVVMSGVFTILVPGESFSLLAAAFVVLLYVGWRMLD